MKRIKGERGSFNVEAKFKGMKKEEFFSKKDYRIVFGLRNLPAKWEEIQDILIPKRVADREAKAKAKTKPKPETVAVEKLIPPDPPEGRKLKNLDQ